MTPVKSEVPLSDREYFDQVGSPVFCLILETERYINFAFFTPP